MRRIITALILACSALLSTATTHAAVSGPHGNVTVAHAAGTTAATAPGAGSAGAAKQTRNLTSALHTRAQRSGAPAGASSQQLYVNSSAFSPATLDTANSGYGVSAQTADKLWFAPLPNGGNHSENYENFGYTDGVYEVAYWTSNSASYHYLGSIYSSATGASNAWNDGVTHTQQVYGTSSTNCSGSNYQCAIMGYTYPDNNGVTQEELYFILQYNQCLIETTSTYPASTSSSTAQQIAGVQDNIDQAAEQAVLNACGSGGTTGGPTPTPTPPPATTDFNVISVRFEKNNLPPDYQLQNPPLTQVKAGTKVDASGYYVIRSAPSNTQVSSEFVVTYKGQTVLDKHYSENYGGPDTYWTALKGLQLKKAGTYQLTITITVNGQRDSDTASISVKKKVAKAKKVSFKFNSLQTQGGSTFRVGQQIPVDIKYSVKHLKGHTTGTIIRSILANLNGQWRAVNTSVIKTTVVNGANDTSVSAQFSAPGTFRIQVGVLIGSGKQQKTVSVNVTR